MHLLSCVLYLALCVLLSQDIVQGEGASSNEFKIFFVNDLNYGFFPFNKANGSACKNVTDDACTAGLARLSSLLNTTGASKRQNSNIITIADGQSGSNAIWLNAGNFLGKNSECFDLLKFQPAADAMNSLNFDAVALGSEVFQYGREAASNFITSLKNGTGFAVNVNSPNKTKQPYQNRLTEYKTFKLAGQDVTIIGFLDKEEMRLKDDTGLKIDDEVFAIENFIINSKAKNGDKNIFIAIGSVKSFEMAQRIANISGLHMLIFSGGSNFSEKFKEGVFVDHTQDAWYISTLPPNVNESHQLLGEVTVTVNDLKLDVDVKVHNYSDTKRINDSKILKIETEGLAKLNAMKYDPVAYSKSSISNDSCLKKECLLGNLVTDAMVAATDGVGNQSIGAAIWTQYPMSKSLGIKADVTFSEEDLHKLLGFPDDSIYTLTVKFNKFIEFLQKALSMNRNGQGQFLQISGLFLDYKQKDDGTCVITAVRAAGSDMRLEFLDMTSDANITVALPAHLLFYDFDLGRFPDAEDKGVSVASALTDYIGRPGSVSNILHLPIVGVRYVAFPDNSGNMMKCFDNTSEAVLMTLTGVVLIISGALLIWCVILPRIRARRGSTSPLIY